MPSSTSAMAISATTSASSPRRTVSVSVFAPVADLAFRNSSSSIWSVFFILTILPYHSI